HAPGVLLGVVEGGVPQSAGPVDLAQAVHDVDQAPSTLAAMSVRPGGAKGVHHAEKGPDGVGGEEEVVQNDEQRKDAGLADGPGAVPPAPVEAVDEDDGGGVETGDGDGHPGREQLAVELRRDVEGLQPGGLDGGWRQHLGARVGGEAEERGGRQAQADRHHGVVDSR
ncbi:hypothetical protein FQN49_008923, partial [Arthroderma sp. PD_2]